MWFRDTRVSKLHRVVRQAEQLSIQARIKLTRTKLAGPTAFDCDFVLFNMTGFKLDNIG